MSAPDWKAMYEQEAAKFQAETLRSWQRGEVIRRLYDSLAGAWRGAGVSEEARLRFFTDGFPPEERATLVMVLPDADADWIKSAPARVQS